MPENNETSTYAKRIIEALQKISESSEIIKSQAQVYATKEIEIKKEFAKTSEIADAEIRASITTRLVNDQLVLTVKQAVMENAVTEIKKTLKAVLEKLNAR